MQINVRRGGFGPMGGAVCALGIAAGLLSLIEPLFRPIGLATFGLGVALAGVLAWKNRRNRPASITQRDEGRR